MAQIYLDHAATTGMDPEVLNEMLPFFTVDYYNPSTLYQGGVKVKKCMEEARERIAACICANPEEIYFTSGGTESDNWILDSIGDGHFITSNIEHHAILNTCDNLVKQGNVVDYLKVDKYGQIQLEQLEALITDKTSGISIQYANNEIGTIQPIVKIGELAKKYHILFHTDAVQACGHIPIDVKRSNLNALSASAHKFNGPKGIGFLYADKQIKLKHYMKGGSQERMYRAGTENVPGIIGMAKALELACATMTKRMIYEKRLREYLITRIVNEIPDVIVNGHLFHRLPNNVNIAFRGLNGESLLVLLDTEDIYVSSGSACNSSSSGPSHVIQALGLPSDYEGGVIRMTIGADNSMEELSRVVEVLKQKVQELRSAGL